MLRTIPLFFSGKQILSNDPTENLEILVKFKDNPNTKNLEWFVWMFIIIIYVWIYNLFSNSSVK